MRLIKLCGNRIIHCGNMLLKLSESFVKRDVAGALRNTLFKTQGSCWCSEPTRRFSYYKSRTEESPDKYTKYEKSFKEWKFVEKLIPPTHVPAAPTDPSVTLPSGWRAPNTPSDSVYVIRRTKNHMIPVYLQIEDRGQTRHTYIKKVEGNIWQFEKDIGKYLQTLRPTQPVTIRTNEISRHVVVKGDFVEETKAWLLERGY